MNQTWHFPKTFLWKQNNKSFNPWKNYQVIYRKNRTTTGWYTNSLNLCSNKHRTNFEHSVAFLFGSVCFFFFDLNIWMSIDFELTKSYAYESVFNFRGFTNESIHAVVSAHPFIQNNFMQFISNIFLIFRLLATNHLRFWYPEVVFI